MNPPTDRLTVLLVSDDPALLADEAGGTVPVWTDYGKTAKHLYSDASDEWDWRPVNMPSGGMTRALLITRDGEPLRLAQTRVKDRIAAKHGRTDAGRFYLWQGAFGMHWELDTYETTRGLGGLRYSALDLKLPYCDDPVSICVALAKVYTHEFPGARVVLLRDGREVQDV